MTDPASVSTAAGFLILTAYSAIKSREASARSKPTSNGFASHVRKSLDNQSVTLARLEAITGEISRRLDRVETRVDRITDHMLDDGR